MTFGTFYRCRAGSFSTTFSQSRLTSAGKNKSALRMKCRKSGRLVENRRSAVQWPKLQRSIPAHAATDPRPGVPHAWLDCFFHQRSIAVLRQFAALPAKLGNDGMVTLTLALVLWNAPAATARCSLCQFVFAFTPWFAEHTRMASTSATLTQIICYQRSFLWHDAWH